LGVGSLLAGVEEERTVFSVWIRRGPDRLHYDLVFDDDKLRLVYLGEYWDKDRPPRGLQRSADMLLYSIKKRRRREGDDSLSSSFDIVISYCDIRSYRLVKPADFARRILRLTGGRTRHAVEPRGILELILADGRRLYIEFSPKVYEIVKRLVKRYLVPAVEKCRSGSG
jgi:hypothetical protein